MNADKANVNTGLEHYLQSGQQFGDGEKFYLLGFDAALQRIQPKMTCGGH